MRIGYCSPFNPMHSGISDFSEELVFALKEQMEVVLFSPVEPENKALRRAFEWHLLSELDKKDLRDSLDLIVYHVGNNADFHREIVAMMKKYRGIMELHDIGVHHLIAGIELEGNGKDAYMKVVEYCHGQYGLQIAEVFFAGESAAPWEMLGIEMCMNRELVDCASAVIVHSDFAKQMLMAEHPNIPIAVVPLHSLVISEPAATYRAKCRQALQIPQDRMVFGSFGSVSEAKRIPSAIRAMRLLKDKIGGDFTYYLVGGVDAGFDVNALIEENGLTDQVKVVGRVELEDFECYMGACDVCINLRYPTRGESSASLHRVLGMGKPVIVTAIGTFNEYPDDIVRKVGYDDEEVQDICNALCELIQNPVQLQSISEKALLYASTHFSLEKNAVRYRDFFEKLLHNSWQEDWEDHLVDVLMDMDLTSPEYSAYLEKRLRECAFLK